MQDSKGDTDVKNSLLDSVGEGEGVLSAALSQHHLSGFEIAQLELHHLH